MLTPTLNSSAQVLADEWIPIRPGADTPMLLAIANVLISEDNPTTNPLIDWDFVKRCTIGFDKNSLPDGADPEDNFHDYVMGLDASGKTAPKGHKNYPAKTPRWASEICGTPPEKIRSFALEIAQTKPVAFMESDASARINDAQTMGQAFTAVAAMIGSIGVDRRRFRSDPACDQELETRGPNLVSSGSSGTIMERPENVVKLRINNNEVWSAVRDGEYTSAVDEKTKVNIQCIFFTKGSRLQTIVGQAVGIEAIRKGPEFVFATDFHMATGCRYSDVVLPVTIRWERYNYVTNPNREALFWMDQVVEPMFEAKDDAEIDREMGLRLGVYTPDACRNLR